MSSSEWVRVRVLSKQQLAYIEHSIPFYNTLRTYVRYSDRMNAFAVTLNIALAGCCYAFLTNEQ